MTIELNEDGTVSADFTKTDEAGVRTPLRAGRYLCQCYKVTAKQSQKGISMWSLAFAVLEGPLGGEPEQVDGRIVWDNLVWTPEALSRAKLICKRLGGIDVDKPDLKITENDFLQKYIYLDLIIGEYKRRKRNEVDFAGYTEAPDDARTAEAATGLGGGGEEDIPF